MWDYISQWVVCFIQSVLLYNTYSPHFPLFIAGEGEIIVKSAKESLFSQERLVDEEKTSGNWKGPMKIYPGIVYIRLHTTALQLLVEGSVDRRGQWNHGCSVGQSLNHISQRRGFSPCL